MAEQNDRPALSDLMDPAWVVAQAYSALRPETGEPVGFAVRLDGPAVSEIVGKRLRRWDSASAVGMAAVAADRQEAVGWYIPAVVALE